MVDSHIGIGSALVYAAATVIAAVLCVRRPVWATSLLIATIPFPFERYIGPTTASLPKAVLVGIILGLIVDRRPLARLGDRAVWPLFAGALAIALSSALSSLGAEFRGPALRETLKAVEYALAFIAGTLAAEEGSEGSLTAKVFAVTTLVVCVMALGEEVGGARSVVAIGGHLVARIAGPLEGPNQLSGFLGLALPLFLARALFGQERVLSGATVGVAALTLLLTLSRAGIATTLVAAAAVAAIARPAARAVPAYVATALGGLAVLAAFLGLRGGARFGLLGDSEALNGLATRSELWHAALTFWRQRPLLGIGPGNYELRLPEVGLLGVKTHANSLYLQSLAEGGVLLFVATLYALSAALVICGRLARRHALAAGMFAATLGLALHQGVDDLFFYPKVGELWWLWLGLAVATARARVATPDSRRAGAKLAATGSSAS